jgi:hypothetical protein
LSYHTKNTLLKELAKFCIVTKLDSHIVVTITRDVLIKAKNTYKIHSTEILKVFATLKLTLPKNIEILITSLDHQKVDVDIFPI